MAVLIALVLPPAGFVLGLYWASQRHRAGETIMVALMLGAAALAAVAFFAPVWFWSHLMHL